MSIFLVVYKVGNARQRALQHDDKPASTVKRLPVFFL